MANAAAVLQALGRSSEALEAGNQALAIFPDSAFVHFLRGNLREQMRNFAGVISGREKPVLSGRDGTVTLATTLAITRSAQTGAPVHVADMMAEPKQPRRT